jgi:hypothetical protein
LAGSYSAIEQLANKTNVTMVIKPIKPMQQKNLTNKTNLTMAVKKICLTPGA